MLAAYAAAVEKAKVDGKPEPKKPEGPRNPFTDAYRPTGYYNSKIAPLAPYALKGVLWYQGESNSGHAREYLTLFSGLIKGWRDVWGQELPFLFVQLPDYRGTPPEMREIQQRVAREVPKTAMVVTIDAGDPQDIHPPDKEPVGKRLAVAARAFVYGEKIEGSGPVFDEAEIEGGRAVLRFTHVGGGLVAKAGGAALTGFVVTTDKKTFVPAKAEIVDETIVVTSESGAEIKAVRYGWENAPVASLYNKEGLPASPFRTDEPK